MFEKKRWTAVVLALVVLAVSSFPTLGDTGIMISSISLRIMSDIEVGKKGGKIKVSSEADHYYISDFYITNEPEDVWKSGDKPKVRIVLGTQEGDYYFKSGFSKNDVDLNGSGASVFSVSRNSPVMLVLNLSLDPLAENSSQYDLDVYGLKWDESQGSGHWERSRDAKRYEVKIYLGEDLLNSSMLDTMNTEFDFSEYIGESGDYTFKVRGVYNSTKKSSWAESNPWHVDLETAAKFGKPGSVPSEEGQEEMPSGSSRPSEISGGETSDVPETETQSLEEETSKNLADETQGYLEEGTSRTEAETESQKEESAENGSEGITGNKEAEDGISSAEATVSHGGEDAKDALADSHDSGDSANLSGEATAGDGAKISGSAEKETDNPAAGFGGGTWLKDSIGWWYCNEDQSYTINNWQNINHHWYFFDENGYMVTGWVNWNGNYYFCRPDGSMMTEDWTPDGYYVGSDGIWKKDVVHE